LTEVLIGTGGWAYFNVPAIDRLAAYARYFNFVEVNSTYYELPSIKIAESWRRRVPEDFNFSVRCHKSIYQGDRLRSIDENKKTLRRMTEICGILRARVLHVLTPASFVFDDHGIKDTRKLFQLISQRDFAVALEVRRKAPSEMPLEVLDIMRRFGVLHCIDISKEKPQVESTVLYSRLFGKGVHNLYQFDDQELELINRAASENKFESSALSFHGVKMHTDALRLLTYRKSGKFPKVTRSVGADSLEDVMKEGSVFPASKTTLLVTQGWKVFDLTETKRVHASDLLQNLPDRTFKDVRDVIESLRTFL